MKKHYKGLAVALSALMIAGSGFSAYAGPADEAAGGAESAPQSQGPGPGGGAGGTGGSAGANAGTGVSAQEFNESQSAVDETALHAAVNYVYESYGDITALSMELKNFQGIGGISYRAYTNSGGYLWWYHDGLPTGVPGDGNYIEAVQVVLTGEAERQFDVYYSATSSGQGKMGWAKNGEVAGTTDIGEKLLSLEVMLVPKGSAGPESSAPRYRASVSDRLILAENGTTMSNEDGTPYNGWLSHEFNKYYFVDGAALTGWQYVDGLKFCFDSQGRLIQDVDALIGKQSSYLLKVNKTLNCLTVYAQDGNNGYIIPVKAMLTSVGDDTPIGTFKTPEKYRWRLMVNDTYTQYATRITKGFLLHSITYEDTKEDSLLTVGYNGLGVTRSLGCVRLTCGNSKWIYDNCALGTSVQIYEDPYVASPFNKPELIPISESQRWDPTDPLFQ